ncbi:hypothetical protein HKX48_006806 [Thoreauomyces humboldtii]|nr:hypothetical protein HKX48_006806 [Thoreauomyces humboldtii]
MSFLPKAFLLDTTDVVILSGVGLLSAVYFLFLRTPKPKPAVSASGPAAGGSKGIAPASPSLGKKSLVSKLRSSASKSHLVLFYGSQTGTAEDLATRIGTECTKQYGLPALICDPEEYDMTELAGWAENGMHDQGVKVLFGFFMATYGEGEPTDNAVEFYDWIMAGSGKGDDEGDDEIDDDELLEERRLEGINYVMFGLGNKTYEHFDAIARRLDRRLPRIGAVRVGTLGEGDDDESLEEDFLAWKPSALVAIAKFFGLEVTASGAQRDAPHVPLFDLVDADGHSADSVYWGEQSSAKPRRWLPTATASETYSEVLTKKTAKYDAKHPFYGRLVSSKPLFVEVHDEYSFDPRFALPSRSHKRATVQGTKIRIERHCLHVDLDLTGSGLKYVTGDHVGIWPVNDAEHVDRLAEVLGVSKEEMDQVVMLKPNAKNMSAANAKIPFPTPCTVRTALLNYLDVSDTVKQHQLEILAKYATDATERTALFELSEKREPYVALIEKSRKDLTDLLRVFPSVKLPLSVLLGELLHRISVRYYSISSSSIEDPNKVGITAVMVRYAIPSDHPNVDGAAGEKGEVVVRQGLATSWLERLHDEKETITTRVNEQGSQSQDGSSITIPRHHLPLYIRTSTFRLPSNPRLPVVMVGPGTGVAPFRAFVRERFHMAKTNPAAEVGPTWLFYGCRHPDRDFLYRDEFEAMEREVREGRVKMDLRIVRAFSRVDGERKVYVQERVRELATDVWRMVGVEKGTFYVCGDAKHMAHDVHQALIDIASKQGGLATEDKAKAWVKDLKSAGRYLEDVWA